MECRKIQKQKRYGTHRSMVDSYLCEFMRRQQNKGKDLFGEILNDIIYVEFVLLKKVWEERKKSR